MLGALAKRLTCSRPQFDIFAWRYSECTACRVRNLLHALTRLDMPLRQTCCHSPSSYFSGLLLQFQSQEAGIYAPRDDGDTTTYP
jgi:hypothetical protein